jgi:hypothetical protein
MPALTAALCARGGPPVGAGVEDTLVFGPRPVARPRPAAEPPDTDSCVRVRGRAPPRLGRPAIPRRASSKQAQSPTRLSNLPCFFLPTCLALCSPASTRGAHMGPALHPAPCCTARTPLSYARARRACPRPLPPSDGGAADFRCTTRRAIAAPPRGVGREWESTDTLSTPEQLCFHPGSSTHPCQQHHVVSTAFVDCLPGCCATPDGCAATMDRPHSLWWGCSSSARMSALSRDTR